MIYWQPSEPAAASLLHYQSSESDAYLELPPAKSPFAPSLPFTLMNSTLQHRPRPTVRIQQSSPSPALPNSGQPQSMLAERAFVGSGWGNETFADTAFLNTPPRQFHRQQTHKRKSSGSSITSGGPPSPHDQNTVHTHIAPPDSSNFSPSYDQLDYMTTPLSALTSKSLPTPTDTPTSNSFMASGYHNNIGAQDGSGYPSSAMRRIQSSGPEEEVTYAFSAPQSVSSMSHNSPATPHTNYDVDYDDSKNLYQGYPQSTAYNQALHEVFPDQMCPPPYPTQAQQNMARFNTQLSPHRAVMANILQAANQDHLRTSSPNTSVPRGQSPFRQDSLYIEQARSNSQRNPQQIAAMPVSQASEASKSVSPKELMLDDHDAGDAQRSLFPDHSSSVFSNRRTSSNVSSYQSGLYNPNLSQTRSFQMPQQYPFASQQQSRPESSHHGVPEQTPDFLAHIASMESTVDEGTSEPSSQVNLPLQRPDDTSSDAGTYTCTYHGCTQRFETPAQLQKHKREGHRQLSPSSGPSAQSVALRNSQAGPHKCERINPSTGKPCNSIFSRPYDLTRHEDTIHNARKQKVRCQLCIEEKLFSRNDALTRHLRVVHPEVQWIGKNNRKRRE